MLIASAIYLILGVLGAVVKGAQGSVDGTALATWLGTAVWWWQLRLGLREHGLAQASGRLGRHRSPGRHRTMTTGR
jgi:hypothetical protein